MKHKVSHEASSNWSEWLKVSPPIEGVKVGSVFQRSNGLLQAFFIENWDSSVRTIWEVYPFLWSQWQLSFGGMNATSVSSVSVMSLFDGRLQVFVTLYNNTIYTTWKKTTAENSEWVPWRNFTPSGNNHEIRRIATCLLSDGRVQLFVTTSHNVLTTWKTSIVSTSAWAPWSVFYESTDDDTISAANLPDGRTQLWRLGSRGQLSSCWKVSTDPNSAWSPWTPFDAPGWPIAFTVAPLSDDRLQVWVADQNGAIHTRWKVDTNPNANWTPWQRFPEP
ncbi:hypothetical protein P4528_24305 [Bacillus thuringiensis]|nr:hypothetical protein [Bacillus thuringiensis]